MLIDIEARSSSLIQIVNDVTPHPFDRTAAMTATAERVTYRGKDTDLSVPLRPGEVVRLSTLTPGGVEGESVALTLPDLGLKFGHPTRQGVVFEGSRLPVSLVVQPADGGVQYSVVIQDSSAPKEYSFAPQLATGERLLLDPQTGWVLLTDADGSVRGYVTPSWARDARGDTVPTRFEIRQGVLVQVVEHSDQYMYPIVADPFLGKDLIRSATWTWVPRSKSFGAGWTLRVSVTEWAWKMSGSPVADYVSAAGKYGWDELRAKASPRGFVTVKNGWYGHKPLNRYLTPLWHQYLCHAQYATRYYGSKRPTWNLDEWRQDVGWWRTVRYKCNPPAGGPYRY